MILKPFKLEFEELGGYDAMTSAYKIYDANYNVVCIIDTDDYVSAEDWHMRHSESEEAKRAATIILEALNEKF